VSCPQGQVVALLDGPSRIQIFTISMQGQGLNSASQRQSAEEAN
jgi:hypothetical protein